MTWEVNGFGLNGFQGGDVVGQVESGTTPSYTYMYIATLLSSMPTTDSQFTLVIYLLCYRSKDQGIKMSVMKLTHVVIECCS